MSINIKDVLPKEVRVTIPVTIRREGEVFFESIKVFSPTLERIELFQKSIENIESDKEILLYLIKGFTDIQGMDDIQSLGNFYKYFDDVFSILEKEMYEILTLVINDGLRCRSDILNLSQKELDKLKEIDPVNGKKIEIAKKEIELNSLKNEVGE